MFRKEFRGPLKGIRTGLAPPEDLNLPRLSEPFTLRGAISLAPPTWSSVVQSGNLFVNSYLQRPPVLGRE